MYKPFGCIGGFPLVWLRLLGEGYGVVQSYALLGIGWQIFGRLIRLDGMLERGLERKLERELGMVVWSCVVLGYRVRNGSDQGFVVMK